MESWIFRLLYAAGACLIVGLCAAAQNDLAPSRGLLLVANKGEHTLGIIDPVEGRQIATVEEGGVSRRSARLCSHLWQFRRGHARHRRPHRGGD